MAIHIGAASALRVSTANEVRRNNPRDHMRMDLRNNSTGAAIGATARRLSRFRFIQERIAIRTAFYFARSGRLRSIR